MSKPELSFSDLEKRIRAIPDGPVSVLNTPSWVLAWDVFGTLGIILGLLPSLLIQWMEPQMWMVGVARFGLGLAVVGYLPGFVRNTWVVVNSMRRWKAEQPKQLDHDFAEFRRLAQSLAEYPCETLAEHLRFAKHVQARLAAKLGILAGGLDKLGILPILVAIGLQLKALNDLGSVPLWQAVIGLFFAVTYLIAMIGALMRVRLQLYEFVLSEALFHDDKSK